eukprot:1980994-Pleurochrysis_carterae.AAC.1
MSATTAFIIGGYAAAAFARERPCASRPCATETWPSAPCVHRAARRRVACGAAARAMAMVVYLRGAAPSAHWAK